MTLFLLLDMSQIECDEFGIPDFPEPPDPRIEETLVDIDESYMDVLEEEFYKPVNNLCGTILDMWEQEFFDKSACAKIRPWLEERLASESVPEFLIEPYKKLLEYVARAIDLNTGVVIEG